MITEISTTLHGTLVAAWVAKAVIPRATQATVTLAPVPLMTVVWVATARVVSKIVTKPVPMDPKSAATPTKCHRVARLLARLLLSVPVRFIKSSSRRL